MSLRENQFTSQRESRICIFFTGISERPRSQSILPTKTNEIFFRYSRKKAFEKKKKIVFRLKVAFKSNSNKCYQGIFTNIDINSSLVVWNRYLWTFLYLFSYHITVQSCTLRKQEFFDTINSKFISYYTSRYFHFLFNLTRIWEFKLLPREKKKLNELMRVTTICKPISSVFRNFSEIMV